MGDGTYSVEELEQMLGVRARTIHFWVHSGLLEGPGAGRGARYADEHLGKLFMIQKLRGEGRPLPEIAAAVKQLSPAQLDVLAEQARDARRAPKPRARELIRKWLGEKDGEQGGEDSSLHGAKAVARAVEEHAVYSRRGGSRPAAARESSPESWTRLPLRDDVELHVKKPLSPESKALVDALLAIARPDRT
jgi:DNA-binding transcriptional MerR regulator